MNVNFLSLFAAAKESVRGFRTLPADAPKVFFYTGNKLNILSVSMPPLLSLAIGKVASSYVIRDSASSYTEEGFRFYYIDERTPSGAPVSGDLNGEAHGVEFWKLVQAKEQLPWQYTFTKGKGYVDFELKL
jgi:hypothetical protein